eukprot:CAMPEP_0170591460 /NCGR_PEP_ID=MMETSP0224-20130122/12417_1 /TAXON_ID=285029 /ORGANISM="Togula jolla, Strain CCCM 725" /LENGTH=358 /DNA_ID=CAMNT_0010915329 /DNA_START=45 /DNA_END=1121 /DNA_ORIENTATION=+
MDHRFVPYSALCLVASVLRGSALNLASSFQTDRIGWTGNASAVRLLEVDEYVAEKSPAGCELHPDQSIRTLLRVIVPNNHGSTAMQAVLMSSSSVATLCTSNVWQCEGHKLLEQQGHGSATEELDSDLMLETYSKFWNLERPVLLDKKTKWMSLAIDEDRPLLEATPPRAMRRLGVRSIQPAYLIMYKHICLWPMSHFVTQHVQADPKTHAQRELAEIEEQVELHRYLVSAGRPVLVVNYADLIKHPHFTRKRLEAFLPCAGAFDMDFVPQLGVDVFPGNAIKITTGVQTYGNEANLKQCCNFQLGKPRKGEYGKCLKDDTRPNQQVNFRGGLEQFLDSDEQSRLELATRYLDELSYT